MPNYHYTSTQGNGIVQARNARLAKAKLINAGIDPTQLSKKTGRTIHKPLQLGKPQWLSLLTSLHALLLSHFSLLQSLHFLALQANHRTASLLNRLMHNLQSGDSFSEALSQQTKKTPPWLIATIHIGEASGALTDNIALICETLTQQIRLTQKIKKTLTYPLLTSLTGMAACFSFLKFSLPQIQQLYQVSHVQLPLATRLLLGLLTISERNGIGILIFLCLLIVLLRQVYQCHRGFRKKCQIFYWHCLPAYQTHRLYALYTMLATLLRANFVLMDALKFLQAQQTCLPLMESLQCIQQNILQGDSFQQALIKTKRMPKLVIQFIALGEQSGRLTEACADLSRHYQRCLQQRLDQLSRWLEPLILCGLAVIIIFLMLAIYLPILNLGNVV